MFSRLNIPQVRSQSDHPRFFSTVREALEIFMGKKNKYDRALTVRDLEKLGINLDQFLKSTKQKPYQI